MPPAARGLPPLPRKLARLTDDLAIIPQGYGFLPLALRDLLPGGPHADGLGLCAIYEPPLRGFKYVVAADISDGLGKDRTSIDVIRQGTVARTEEQVAHFISDRVKPREAAFIVDALGHLYCDDEGREACVAIETNNHGLSTQDTLRLHLGYRHFYVMEHVGAAAHANRFSAREGWYTTQRTRPIVLDHLYEALTTYDPVTGEPDLLINSPHTLGELHDFQTDGALADAAAAAGAHDDCLMSLAIGHYVSWRLAGGEREPLADRRRRLRMIEQRRASLSAYDGSGASYQTMPYTEEEIAQVQGGRVDRLDPELEELLYDLRGETYDGFY
jgi:hypothetical protein